MEAEVGSRSTQVELNGAADVRAGEVHVANAGAVHNPTVEKAAAKLALENSKKTVRTICSTHWCETEEQRVAEFHRVCEIWPSAKYILYGPLETSEENKRNHCHVIVAFSSSKQWKTILKTLPSVKYHHEACRNFTASREYCLKENPQGGLEFGTPLKQGDRSDLKKLMEENHYDARQIREADAALYSRYRNGILDICNDKARDQEVMDWLNLKEDEDGKIVDKEYKPAEVHWFSGSTGTGKTLSVKQTVGEMVKSGAVKKDEVSIIAKMENGFAIGTIQPKTRVLILDEFRGCSMKFSDLLALIDGTSINVKGGKQWMKPEHVFITSCFTPRECYTQLAAKDSINQLLRRITEFRSFDKPEEEASPDLWD